MADDDHLTSIPRSPTDHEHEQQEISAAALDSINHHNHNPNLGESLSSSSSGGGGSSSSRSRVNSGHERGFVQPASYLRRRGLSHPMAASQPERAGDSEEQMGLVSV
jgi:5'-AMP-activated protein kinase, regulatory gamma subunit